MKLVYYLTKEFLDAEHVWRATFVLYLGTRVPPCYRCGELLPMENKCSNRQFSITLGQENQPIYETQIGSLETT